MTELNYRVDYLKQSPEKVAKDFLMEQSLYKEPQNGNGGTIRIGSKIPEIGLFSHNHGYFLSTRMARKQG